MKELKRFQVMRRIELEGAEQQQTTHSKAVPKRGTGFQPVENMAKMAMPLDKAPSLRDEAATRCVPAENNSDLKKQSQIAAANSDIKSFMKGDYDKMEADGAEKNKAKQTQFLYR
jgi:hypothetical protein